MRALSRHIQTTKNDPVRSLQNSEKAQVCRCPALWFQGRGRISCRLHRVFVKRAREIRLCSLNVLQQERFTFKDATAHQYPQEILSPKGQNS